MHLLLDLGELGATLVILWRCLHAYQPLAAGLVPGTLAPTAQLALPGPSWPAPSSRWLTLQLPGARSGTSFLPNPGAVVQICSLAKKGCRLFRLNCYVK